MNPGVKNEWGHEDFHAFGSQLSGRSESEFFIWSLAKPSECGVWQLQIGVLAFFHLGEKLDDGRGSESCWCLLW